MSPTDREIIRRKLAVIVENINTLMPIRKMTIGADAHGFRCQFAQALFAASPAIPQNFEVVADAGKAFLLAELALEHLERG